MKMIQPFIFNFCFSILFVQRLETIMTNVEANTNDVSNKDYQQDVTDIEYHEFLENLYGSFGDDVDNDVADLSHLGIRVDVPLFHPSEKDKEELETTYLRGLQQSCSKGCSSDMIGDGICQYACKNQRCQMDKGDCIGWDVTLVPISNITEELSQAVTSAASRWKKIVGDLPGAVMIPPGFDCNGIVFDNYLQYDEMLLVFGVEYIDGVNGTLAYASPCGYVKIQNRHYPAAYMIIFDVDDYDRIAAGGNLETVILHELGHALGIGSMWDFYKLLKDIEPLSYKGKGGIQGLKMIGGEGMPIVEENGGNGTARSHWDEDTYGDELMTGYLKGVKGKLSKMTIDSLTDLGYQVKLNLADNYTIPNSGNSDNLRFVKTEHDKGVQMKGCIRKPKKPPTLLKHIPDN